MRIEIDSKASDGLSVISEIPSINPCLLEGRNGIGKTIAVNLLQLVAGGQPFEDDRLWRSLRDRLGATKLHMTEMADAKSMSFTFTPENWPDSPLELEADQLGKARINGKSVSAEEAASLLSVVRIAGNEDISKTLETRVQTIQTCLSATRDRLAATRSLVSESLDGVVSEIRRADPSALADDEARLEEIEEELNIAIGRAFASREREATLHQAMEAKAQIEALADPENALVIEREKLRQERTKLIAERDQLEEEVDAMAEELSKRGDPQGTHVAAERVLRHRLKRLEKFREEFGKIAAEAELVESDKKAIRKEFGRLEAEREKLEQAREEFGGTDSVRDLLGELAPPLEEASQVESISGQVLLEDEEVRLTVSDVSNLVNKRADALSEIQKPGELQGIEGRLGEIANRMALLHECTAKLEEINKQLEAVSVAQAEEAEAKSAAKEQGVVDEKYRAANQQLGALQEQIDTLTAKLAEVSRHLGSLGNVSVEDAMSTLRTALDAIGASEEDLTDLQSTIPRDTLDLDLAVERLKKEAALVRRSIKAQERELEVAATLLSSHPELSWLHELLVTSDSADSGELGPFEEFARARDALLSGQQQFDQAVEMIDNLLGIARTVTFKDDPDRLAQRFGRQFVEAIGMHLRGVLGTKSIQELLFDDAELIGVDPVAGEITLKTANGPIARPLAGFSTGEQAFAYTQARILDLAPSEKSNRILFLDEFGAFVAADRLPALASFLGGDEVRKLVDQVVVILPLHVDYENEVAETTGELRKRYEERLKQIDQRDYCAVELQT